MDPDANGFTFHGNYVHDARSEVLHEAGEHKRRDFSPDRQVYYNT